MTWARRVVPWAAVLALAASCQELQEKGEARDPLDDARFNSAGSPTRNDAVAQEYLLSRYELPASFAREEHMIYRENDGSGRRVVGGPRACRRVEQAIADPGGDASSGQRAFLTWTRDPFARFYSTVVLFPPGRSAEGRLAGIRRAVRACSAYTTATGARFGIENRDTDCPEVDDEVIAFTHQTPTGPTRIAFYRVGDAMGMTRGDLGPALSFEEFNDVTSVAARRLDEVGNAGQNSGDLTN